MIKDKNIFECIIIGNQVFLPRYVIWAPASAGYQRRGAIFQKHFPNKTINNLMPNGHWEKLRKNNNRRIFSYDESSRKLTEVNDGEFFTNAFGIPIKIGESILVNNVEYEIKSLEVIKWAGLIAGYESEGKIKKTNISDYNLDKEDNIWKRSK